MNRSLVQRLAGAMLAAAILTAPFLGSASTALAATPSTASLRNQSSMTITELYVVPASSGPFRNNLLTGKTFPSGQNLSLTLAAGTCFYDIAAITETGYTTVEKNIDLCATRPGNGPQMTFLWTGWDKPKPR